MSSPFPVLNNKPIDQWKVTELKEELKRRKLPLKGLKEELVRRLDESLREEMDQAQKDKEQEKEEKEEESSTPPVEFKTGEDLGFSPVQETETSEKENTEIASEEKTETGETLNPSCEIATEEKTETGETLNPNCEIAPEEKMETIDETLNPNREIAPEEQMETIDEALNPNSEIAPEEKMETIDETLIPKCETGSEERTGTEETLNPKPEAVEEPKSEEEKSTGEEKKAEQTEQVSEQVQVKETGTKMKKCESISKSNNTELTESISVKNDDNLNTDNFDLEKKQQQEIEVKQDEPQDDPKNYENAPNDSENNNNNNNNNNENLSGGGSPEKLSSADDSMEEVNYENAPDIVSPVEGTDLKEVENYENAPEETDNSMDVVASEDKAPAEKRKLVAEETVQTDENTKRQRRWNNDSVKIPERETANLSQSDAPKDSVSPSVNKHVFNRSESNLSTDSPKERIVPPSQKEATNSLRIDRFLRPFTLKAVQDLLGKTGTVSSFWMDHIKTHCYVTYSSTEEAISTRSALHNLKWPPNGGNTLSVSFVDPADVQSRLSAPPPAASPRPKPSQAPLLARENSARGREPPAVDLPPPPPLRKTDPAPAVVTLDDLFRKTKAVPRVYYLPCSEEKVAAKVAARAKAAKE